MADSGPAQTISSGFHGGVDTVISVDEVAQQARALARGIPLKQLDALAGPELAMDPKVLLVDEPSIGLEPRFIDMVFEILGNLQHKEGKTIVMVEQNAKKGLEFANIGYVLVSGELAVAGKARDLLADPDVGRLFLGG